MPPWLNDNRAQSASQKGVRGGPRHQQECPRRPSLIVLPSVFPNNYSLVRTQQYLSRT